MEARFFTLARSFSERCRLRRRRAFGVTSSSSSSSRKSSDCSRLRSVRGVSLTVISDVLARMYQAWVFGILRHKIVHLIRQQGRSINTSALGAEGEELDRTLEGLFDASGHWSLSARPLGWNDPDAALHQQDFWNVFDACLNRLPENTARVFML